MTDNERANKVYLACLKYGRKFIHELPLPKHDISVGRKTPKSEFLLELDKESKVNTEKRNEKLAKQQVDAFNMGIGAIKLSNGQANISPEFINMVSVYTGSDLNYFRSESIPTYKSSK